MARTTIGAANVLGSARAESDTKMLAHAFIETGDFRALTKTTDFNFVVGRRGIGKSALFRKLTQHFEEKHSTLLITDTPKEHHTLAIQDTLATKTVSYNLARAACRLSWRISILIAIAARLLKHYKITKTESYDSLTKFRSKHSALFEKSISENCVDILKSPSLKAITNQSLPSELANSFEVEVLQTSVLEALEKLELQAVVIFDGLDEGWEPTAISTAILGGLAITTSAAAETSDRFYGIIFVRDNMFRALATFDTDFSRHIEGSTLRLQWNSPSLLNLVTKRLRIFLEILDVESDIKVWNRFAHRGLRDREGFKACLNHTLYRPRDILVLLNRAYTTAARQGRSEIIEDDINESAAIISQDRLNDLLKEYQAVLPGLEHFIRVFSNRSPIGHVVEFLLLLDNAIVDTKLETTSEGEFAVLGNGRQIFLTLFAVGFLGVRSSTTGSYSFCYDGSPAKVDDFRDDQEVTIHPCYWKALGFNESSLSEEVTIEIGDEYGDLPPSQHPAEIRTKRLGQLIEELPNLALGHEGSGKFEKWVHRTISILFAGGLTNVELKPNSDTVQRRDIVATNKAEKGIWKRIYEDYKTRQVIFEAKNYEEIEADDIRQVATYLTKDYGNFAVLVTRSNSEGLSQREKDWVREIYHTQNKLIFIIPAFLLCRCVSKLRNPNRHDYTEDVLAKRLDIFTRSYVGIGSSRPAKKRRK